MDNNENKKIFKNRMKIVMITWIIMIPLIIGIIIYSNYSDNKNESLECSKKQSNTEIIVTYNYIGGYFSSGNMKVLVDNSSSSEIQTNETNWCEIMKEQSNGLFVTKSCKEENSDNKKIINMDIVFDNSIDRKNVKINDDKQKIEELGFSCTIK